MKLRAWPLLAAALVSPVPPAGVAAAQSDPCSRFRGVKSWELSFTADVDHEGVRHKPGTIRFRASGSGTLAPRAEAQGYLWAGTGDYALSSATRVDRTYPNDLQWLSSAVGAGTAAPLVELAPGQQEPWVLAIRPDCTFDLSILKLDAPLVAHGWNTSGFSTEERTTFPGSVAVRGQPLPEQGLVIQLRLPAAVDAQDEGWADVQVYADNSWAPSSNDDRTQRGTGTFAFTLSPEPEELELVVELPGYETWAPQGSHDPTRAGHHLPVRARLEQRGGGEAQEKARLLRFALVQASAEPGVALNHPPSAQARVDPDLRFETERNPGLVLSDDGLRAETPAADLGVYADASAELSTFDWGAWGELRVTAVMGDGREILGRLRGDPRPQILLPKRRPDSRIPDALRASGGLGELPDDDDGENEPEGDGFAGDGLTLYEEYRGFYVNGLHVRGNPKRKDLFLRDRIGGRSKVGIARFARETGLRVHHELAPAELGDHRVVNVNHMEGPHRVDQHGLVLEVGSTTREDGSTPAGRVVSERNLPGTPKTIERVLIDPGLAPADRYFPRVVAHELGHAVNLYHHGASDVGWVDWTRETRGGRPVAIEGFDPIDLRSEAGAPLALVRDMHVYVASPSGQHSGVDTCLMRYDFADAFRSDADPAVRYWTNGSGEPFGSTLCTDAEGSGVNAAGRQPRPRHGDASVCAGDCVHQVRVADAGDAPERSPCLEDVPAADDDDDGEAEGGAFRP